MVLIFSPPKRAESSSKAVKIGIEKPDQFARRLAPGHPREADDVGEHDADLVGVVGNHRFAGIDAVDNGARQDRQQQILRSRFFAAELFDHQLFAVAKDLVLHARSDARPQQRGSNGLSR